MQEPIVGSIRVARIRIEVFRAPMPNPVVTSFGAITERSAATVVLEDSDGAVGQGDIWGNFPSITTEYRARLAGLLLPDLLLGRTVDDIPAHYAASMQQLRVLAIQSGEYGPIAAAVAAADQALWDLAARRRGLPLRRLLDTGAGDIVPAYASGLNPDDGPDMAGQAREAGHRNFKLKVGFGEQTDRGNIAAIRRDMRGGERLFVDANQRWDLETAEQSASWLADAGVGWLEEPMRADEPDEHWQRLRTTMRLPLAGGENLTDHGLIDRALGWLDIMQPDVGKWGGVSDNAAIARRARARGRIYCPHWLAGGLGLLHSANILAAVGGDGLLEMDVNANPLRDAVIGEALSVEDGRVRLPDGPGLGIETAPDAIAAWRIGAAEFA
ncbi:MAG: mandelate racemase/muconate lactonizing enzyme family protein [Alphaproteobacteria bacterium]|nr:mandelate racemase/muconate lactonizing enzyme family protein [Alphaproteobacteria bacterium]